MNKKAEQAAKEQYRNKFVFNSGKNKIIISYSINFINKIIILNKKHKKLYKDIINFYTENRESIVSVQKHFGVGTDQPIINFFLQKQNFDLKLLSYKFNMQDMALKEILTEDLLFTKLGWIYHYNAIPDNHDSSLTLYWMKKTYEELYDNIS